MPHKPRICVIGSLNVDFVTCTPRVPGPGETLTATSLTVHPGGKGANQAVACGKAAFTSQASQDVTVEMIGAVGANDPYYTSLLQPTLEKSGVSTAGVQELQGVQTGTATILVDEGSNGENRILIVPGANAKVVDVDETWEVATRDGVPDVVVMQAEIPRRTVLALLRAFNAHTCKACVIFNPAPMLPGGIPLEALENLAVLVVNETECRQLFDCVEELKTLKVTDTKDEPLKQYDLDLMTYHLHSTANIKVVIVTLGARGVYYSKMPRGIDGRDMSLIPAAKVEKVVDTTAAGDTFVGYIATALARHLAHAQEPGGFNVADAAGVANNASAKCVQRSGAMESIPFGYE